jgi:hypothetical protein
MSCKPAPAAGPWKSAKLTIPPAAGGICALLIRGQLQGSAAGADPYAVCCLP